MGVATTQLSENMAGKKAASNPAAGQKSAKSKGPVVDIPSRPAKSTRTINMWMQVSDLDEYHEKLQEWTAKAVLKSTGNFITASSSQGQQIKGPVSFLFEKMN